MHHTLVAVFDNVHEAQQARSDLVRSGFMDREIHLNAAQEDREERPGGIKEFFRSLFGDDDRPKEREEYERAMSSGKAVLTLDADESQDARAIEILEQHHPVELLGDGDSSLRAGEGQPRQATRLGGPETEAIPIVEEELKVGKREVQRGGVRIYTKVTERPVEQEINLKEEKVTIERTPIDRPIAGTDANAFREATVEVRETAEEPVVEKAARVVEEVKVTKETRVRPTRIKDTVRKTEVQIDQLGQEYRSHWTQNYGMAGGSYEDYEPAYRYGYTQAGDTRFQGAQWDSSENDLRRDWEERNPNRGWDKFKGAIRYGWDRFSGR